MSMSDNLRKHDLDCLRLASDLTQLANDVLSPAVVSTTDGPGMYRAWLNGQRLALTQAGLASLSAELRGLLSLASPRCIALNRS
jgi:hypothetical protein